jgi:hypothetical protein
LLMELQHLLVGEHRARRGLPFRNHAIWISHFG